jgi:hypothetical protein
MDGKVGGHQGRSGGGGEEKNPIISPAGNRTLNVYDIVCYLFPFVLFAGFHFLTINVL